MTITIIQLYPRDMNLYGDWGNTLALKKRHFYFYTSYGYFKHNINYLFYTIFNLIHRSFN